MHLRWSVFSYRRVVNIYPRSGVCYVEKIFPSYVPGTRNEIYSDIQQTNTERKRDKIQGEQLKMSCGSVWHYHGLRQF